MATQTPAAGTGSTLKAYEDKIAAQIHEANVWLDQFEAKATTKRAEAEVTAVKALKTAREHLERKLADLKTTHESHVARAKADIDTAVAAFQKSIEEFRRKFTSPSEKK